MIPPGLFFSFLPFAPSWHFGITSRCLLSVDHAGVDNSRAKIYNSISDAPPDRLVGNIELDGITSHANFAGGELPFHLQDPLGEPPSKNIGSTLSPSNAINRVKKKVRCRPLVLKLK